MSWRSYGGQTELTNTATLNELTVNNIRIKKQYIGTFDISGNLNVNGEAQIFGNLSVSENLHANKLEISELIVDNIARFNYETYFGISNTDLYLYGLDGNGIGLGTTNPTATLDIVGNNTSSLQVYAPESVNNRNILARNMDNYGVSIGCDTSHSYIQFYKDTELTPEMSQMENPPYDVLLGCYSSGNFVIDVSFQTFILSRMVVNPDNFQSGFDLNNTSNQPDNISHNIFNETLTVYDTSHCAFMPLLFNPMLSTGSITYTSGNTTTGQSASFISFDNCSNTFLHITTPNKTGMAICGGSYPNDVTRSMSVIGWSKDTINPLTNSNMTPAEMFVSSSTNVRTPFSLGMNTYQPETEKYLLTVNGKTHITDGQMTLLNESSFFINRISMSPTPYTLGIAGGYPSTYSPTTNTYSYDILVTTNGGESWNTISLSAQGSNIGDFDDSVKKTITSIYCYDNSYAFIGSTFNYLLYSRNQGNNWHIIDTSNLSANTIQSIYLSKRFTSISGAYIGQQINRFYISYPTSNILSYFDVLNLDNSFNGTSSVYVNLTNVYDSSFSSPTYMSFGKTNTSTSLFVTGINSGVGKIRSYFMANPSVWRSGIDISYQSVNVSSYNGIDAYDDSTVIAVSDNWITYKATGQNWTDISSNLVGKMLDVKFNSSTNAIIMGTKGFLYSKPSLTNPNIALFSNWSVIPNSILNTNGVYSYFPSEPSFNCFALTNLSTDISNSFIFTNNLSQPNIINNWNGNSHIYYGYYPNIFNTNNVVLDICGSMYLLGNMNMDGNTISSTSYTVNLLNTNVKNVNFGGNTSNISIGNVNSGLVRVNNLFNVRNDASFNNNIFVGNNTNVNGNLVVNGGNNIINGNITVNGNNTVVVNLDVRQQAIFRGDVNILSGNISLNGNFSSVGNVSITGDICGNNIICKNNLSVVNNTNLNTLKVIGGANISGIDGLTVGENTTLAGGKLVINNNGTITNPSIYNGGNIVFADNVDISNNLQVKQNANIYNNLTLSGNLILGNNSSVVLNSLILNNNNDISNNSNNSNIYLYSIIMSNSYPSSLVLLSSNTTQNLQIDLNMGDNWSNISWLVSGSVFNIIHNTNNFTLSNSSLNSSVFINYSSSWSTILTSSTLLLTLTIMYNNNNWYILNYQEG